MNSIIEKLEIRIFKIYLLLIPFTVFDPIKLENYIGAIGEQFVFIFQVIGILLIILYILKERKIRINKCLIYLFFMILYLNFSSLIHAFIFHDEFGVLYGEDTYRAVIGDIIYYFQVFIIIYYNYFVGNKIDKDYVLKVFRIIIYVELIIGYLQILILNGFDILSYIHNILSSIGITAPIDDIIHVKRIFLTNSEPSIIGETLGYFVIPYLSSKILLYGKKKELIILLLYMPIVYFSGSSTVYIVVVIELLTFTILLIKKYKISKRILKNTILTLIFSSVILTVFGRNVILNFYENKIKYILVEKINDSSNHSTVFRMSTVKNNINVFFRHPLTGVGNGLQGYYYEKNLEANDYKSEEVQNFLRGERGIPSGGSFLTGYISAYGIIGVTLLIIYVRMNFKFIEKNNELYYIYLIAIIGFISMSAVATNITNNYQALFIISIPLVNSSKFIKTD